MKLHHIIGGVWFLCTVQLYILFFPQPDQREKQQFDVSMRNLRVALEVNKINGKNVNAAPQKVNAVCSSNNLVENYLSTNMPPTRDPQK